MCNLPEYSKNYSKTTGSLCNYDTDEGNIGVHGGTNYSISGSKSFDYKVNFIEGSMIQNNLTKNDVEIVVPLNI